MSHRLIAHSPELLRLRQEGYDLEVRGAFLLVKDVPYVAPTGGVRRGVFVTPLNTEFIDGVEVAAKPNTHIAYWRGEHPHHADGAIISAFQHSSGTQDLGDGIVVDHMFSAKADYRDLHHKVTVHLARIVGEARHLEPLATAQTRPVYVSDEEEPVFKYIDTASGRSRIGAANDRLAGLRIGIVGLGGTGGYILDLVAKTRVGKIRLFDGDRFDSHNAFRAPGAASIPDLEAKSMKVNYFAGMYGRMRNGVEVVDAYVDASNVDALMDLDFIFICIDRGEVKKTISDALSKARVPFIDVGMGVVRQEGGLGGLVRVTTCTAEKQDHLAGGRIPFFDAEADENEYSTNVQIAELNALNAALAVIRWKKHFGFYRNSGREHYASYSIAANEIVNEEVA